MKSHFDCLASILLQMVDDVRDDVAKEGASEVTARWLFLGYFTDEVERCLTGTVAQRKGVARIAACLPSNPEYDSKCAALIVRLQNDPEKDVRHSWRGVASIDVLSTPGGLEIVKAFIQSQAFRDDPSGLMFALQEHTGPMKPFAEILL